MSTPRDVLSDRLFGRETITHSAERRADRDQRTCDGGTRARFSPFPPGVGPRRTSVPRDFVVFFNRYTCCRNRDWSVHRIAAVGLGTVRVRCVDNDGTVRTDTRRAITESAMCYHSTDYTTRAGPVTCTHNLRAPYVLLSPELRACLPTRRRRRRRQTTSVSVRLSS